MFTSHKAQALVSSLGEAQKRWWGDWFELVGGIALSPGLHAAGLWQSNLDAWKRSLEQALSAQQDATSLFRNQERAASSPLEAFAASSAALVKRPATSDFKIGDSASLSKTVTEADITTFALLTGDVNPVHLNDAYAAKTRFGKRVAHGVLSAGLISAVLGTELPGPGSVYLSQTLKFRAPVFVGDEVTATVTVTDKKEGKPIYTLATVCTKGDGTVVLDGEAVILYEPV